MQFKKKSIKHTETILFILIWVVFFLSNIFVTSINETFEWKRTFSMWIMTSPFVVFSIINHFFLMPYLYYKRKLVYFIVAISLILAFSFSLRLLPDSVRHMQVETDRSRLESFQRPIRPLASQGPGFNADRRQNPRPLPPQRQRNSPVPPWVNSLIIGFLVMGFDIGLRVSFRWSKTEREREKSEKERIKSELAFLRNQLSPHFFMNTLNNIHALIDIDSEEAKESVIQLSRLMRHLLYDSDQESIPLSKEVSFIQSYVDLMKLRFTDKVNISFKVDSNIANVTVPPLLFTSLIENAFKYGVSYKQDSFISIALAISENVLQFTIQNSKPEVKIEKDDNASGIGLANTKKRLDLLYAENYEMKIDETYKTFSVDLKIPL